MILKEITKGRKENSKGWTLDSVDTTKSGLMSLKLEDGTFSARITDTNGLIMETNNEGVFVNWLINQQVKSFVNN